MSSSLRMIQDNIALARGNRRFNKPPTDVYIYTRVRRAEKLSLIRQAAVDVEVARGDSLAANSQRIGGGSRLAGCTLS